MSSYIVSTKIKGIYSTLAADGSAVGTTGPLSMESITRAPEEGNPHFVVAAVTSVNGGFVAGISMEPSNPTHKEEFSALVRAAARKRPRGDRT